MRSVVRRSPAIAAASFNRPGSSRATVAAHLLATLRCARYPRGGGGSGMLSTFQPTTASAAVQGLPQVFDPTVAEGVEAAVLIDLQGREPGQWTVVIHDRTCRVMHGRTMEPTVTESMDSDLWLAVARGEQSVQEAIAAHA